MDTPEPESEADRRAAFRAHLRANGWTYWREEQVRVPDLVIHMVEVFSADHAEGPLVRWQHPETCDCWADSLLTQLITHLP